MATAEEVMTRRAEVEAILLRGAWTLQAQAAMARRNNCTTRAVQRDAAHVRRRWAKNHKRSKREEERAGVIERGRAAQGDAAKGGAHIARGRLLQLEARVCGHSEPVQIEITHRAEMMSPIDQARAIVSKADEARAFLADVAHEQLEEIQPNVIEVKCE